MPKRAMTLNMPSKPIDSCKGDATTNDRAKVNAILPPTIAMARVRVSSLVKSANHAVTAAEIAPAPCIALPAVIQTKSSWLAAMRAPKTNNAKPNTTTGRRPYLSDSIPRGMCKHACTNP